MQLDFHGDKERKVTLNLDDYNMVEDIFSGNQKFQEFNLVKKHTKKGSAFKKTLTRVLSEKSRKAEARREERLVKAEARRAERLAAAAHPEEASLEQALEPLLEPFVESPANLSAEVSPEFAFEPAREPAPEPMFEPVPEHEGHWAEIRLKAKAPFWTKKRVRVGAFALAALILLPVLGYAVADAFPRDALRVVYCDEVIGTVRSEKDFYKALEAAEETAEKAYGHAVVMQAEASFVETKVDSKEISSKKELTEAITETVQFAVESATILENNDVRCVVADAATAEEVLSEVLASKKGDQYEETSFANEVTIGTAYALAEDILEKDEAVAKLLSVEEGQKPYEVQKNDTLWDISQSLGISLEKLGELNPGLGDHLSIGQEIIVEAPQPVISVLGKARREFEEEIPFETEKIEDNTMAKGKTKVVTEGVPGKKWVVADITYLNDAEAEREVISEEVLSEPVKEVVRVGTLTTAATGSFAMPAYGSYTSRFGRRWGSTHTGLDIGASHGSAVSAADGGVVEFAGWSGGYGNLVRINHGNGYVTYYAHMSRITVSKGQRVAKGQQVGKVGSTGNSTGPHLHFEIRKNGQILNPENFLRK